MKKYVYILMMFIISALTGFISFEYFTEKLLVTGFFLSGTLFGIFLMMLKLNVKNNTINSYKRELERKSVSAIESDDRVKVLESKIEVLEKALEKALNKNS